MRNHGIKQYIFAFIITPLFIGAYYVNTNAATGRKMPTANGAYLFTHEIATDSIKPKSYEWADIVGKRVVVQGLFWGANEKSEVDPNRWTTNPVV